MTQTSFVLMALAIAWGGQVVGSWVQWKHYHCMIATVKRKWSDGYVGVGRFRKRFGFGCVAIVVVAPNLQVRDIKILRGISIFARFKDVEFKPKIDLLAIPAELENAGIGKMCLLAVDDAIVRIKEVKEKV